MKILMLCGFLLLVMIASSSSSKVIKINRHHVCFSASGDNPAVFRYRGFHGRVVNGLLLTHRSGFVTCDRYTPHTKSRWGCGDKGLNVVVTDQYNYLIYPRKEYIYSSSDLWYRLPGKHSKHSQSLLFTNAATPFHLYHRQVLKIWYGEDLKNWKEGNNRGRVCVDVYAWLA